MKVAVNMRLPNGAEKTLVYGAKHVADAYTKAKEDHPTWDVIAVSALRAAETTSELRERG